MVKLKIIAYFPPYTVVRVVPISIGNGTFGGPAAQKPLNRST